MSNIITQKTCTYEDIKNNCEIFIILTQIGHFDFVVGYNDCTVEEEVELLCHKFSFKDFIEFNEEKKIYKINIPINETLPTFANPSIYLKDNSDYVKHCIKVEYPYFDSRRTNIFVVKNLIKYHSINRILLSPFHLQNTFKALNIFIIIFFYKK